MSDNATVQGRGRAIGLVPFLFGLAGRTELPGVALRGLLTDLGLSPSAARALVARLRTDGYLASTARGRQADYRLAGSLATAFERIRDHAIRRPVAWSGSFHALLYQVPEPDRAFRDALRRQATLSGYGLLQQGVLIALTDRTAAVADLLDRPPPGARVYVTRLAMPDDAAARAAHDAWDLDGVGRLYRDHIDRLTAVAAPPEPSAAALRRVADVLMPALTDTLRDPGLPPQLLPPDWVGPALHRAIGDFMGRVAPAAAAHVAAVLDGSGPARSGDTP